MVVAGLLLAQVPVIVELVLFKDWNAEENTEDRHRFRIGLIVASVIAFMLIFPEATVYHMVCVLLLTVSWFVLIFDYAYNFLNNGNIFYSFTLHIFLFRLLFFIASLVFFINSINGLNP